MNDAVKPESSNPKMILSISSAVLILSFAAMLLERLSVIRFPRAIDLFTLTLIVQIGVVFWVATRPKPSWKIEKNSVIETDYQGIATADTNLEKVVVNGNKLISGSKGIEVEPKN